VGLGRRRTLGAGDGSAAVTLAADWWTRNAAAVDGISTIVLVIVTAVYVMLTRSISMAAREQAAAMKNELGETQTQTKALTDQVEASRHQLAVAIEAQRHAERIFVESVKARLETRVPLAVVQYLSSRLEIQGDGAPGIVEATTFDQTRYSLVVMLRIVRFNEVPGVVHTRPPRWGAWDLVDPFVLSTEATLVWRHHMTGADWRANAETALPELVVHLRSVDGQVVDWFTWEGRFEPPPQVQNMVRGNDSRVHGPAVATHVRTFPGLTDSAE
jgi:hypothetical protein